MRRFERRVKRTRKGVYELRIPPEERALLRTMPGQLRELLGTDDPSLVRLFPPAYVDDAEREAEYRRFVRDDLVARRRDALVVMERTLDAETVTEDELTGWLSVINDLRLVLGTRLDVSEDMFEDEIAEDDPRAPALALYGYLSWLQEHIVDALAGGL